MEKNTNKGITELLKYSNGLELQFLIQLHGYFYSRYVRDTLREDFAQRAGLIGANVLIALLTTC